ncbi:MAG: exopolysaccharide biosynthesis glycosyltransferase VpsL [Sandaracinaceae bacterium]
MPRESSFFDLRPSGDEAGALTRLADGTGIALSYLAPLLGYDPYWRPIDTIAVLLAILLFGVFGNAMGLYRGFRGVPLLTEIGRVCAAWALTASSLLIVGFFFKETEEFSRVVVTSWFVLAPTLVGAVRAAARFVLQLLRKHGKNQRVVAIVGVTEIGIHLARRIQSTPHLGMRLVGFYDDRTPERLPELPSEAGRLVGTFDDVVTQAKQGAIECVYVALPMRAEARVNALLEGLADTTASVYYVPDFYVFDLLHGRWTLLGDVPLISIFETPFYGVDGVVKRAEDIVLGTLAILVASPVMIATAIAIKLTSKGPVFFKQRRYGLNGEVIEILKFRSMRVQEDGPVVKQATKNDDRITPVGRFIRRTSIDELPQLFHVVTGKMSLVGPRPHAVAHNEEYRKRIKRYMLRHKVKPGLTGWAQVNGWRGETDTLEKMEKRIEHDLEYIRRWGLLFDLWIIFLTVFGRKVRQNAY